MLRTSIFSLLLCATLTVFGQATEPDNNSKKQEVPEREIGKKAKKKKVQLKGIVYNKELSFGGKLSTSGWSFFGDYTRYVNLTKKRVYQFEFIEFKHPKEIKQSNESQFITFGLESPKSYVFGKQNNFYALHMGYGEKYMLGDKAKKSGVEINFTWTAGPSLGIEKPYFLNVIEEGDLFFTIVAQQWDPSDEESLFLTQPSIYGSSGFTFGLGQIKLVPGAYGKAGINFDWASYSEFIKSIEVGIGADVYLRNANILIDGNDIPELSNVDNKFHFVYLYLSLQLGKKW